MDRVEVSGRRRYKTTEEKRRIVEQTLTSTALVASLARQYGVNANQLFQWRKLYRSGQLGGQNAEGSPSVRLLPVSVDNDEPSEAEPHQSESCAPGLRMNIEICGRALISLEGAVDAAMVRAVVESLRG